MSEVRIDVTANTTQAKREMKGLDSQVEKTKGGIKGMQQGFSGLTKALTLFGVGTVSAGFAVNKLITVSGDVAQKTANIAVAYANLPDQIKSAVDDTIKEIPRLSDEFGFTELAIRQALVTLATDSRGAASGVDELAGVLGIARVKGIDAEAAAVLYSQALLGNVSAIQQLTGNFRSLDDAMASYITQGREATTVSHEFSVQVSNLWLSVGNLVNAFDRGQGRVSAFTGVLRDLMGVVQSFPVQALLNIFNPAAAAGRGIGGAIAGIGGSVLDFIQQGGRQDPFPGVNPADEGGFREFGPIAGPGIFPKLGFAHGGRVPGPEGRARAITAHGGEVVLNRAQQQSMGGGLTIQIMGDVVIDDENRMNKLAQRIERLLTQRDRLGPGI